MWRRKVYYHSTLEADLRLFAVGFEVEAVEEFEVAEIEVEIGAVAEDAFAFACLIGAASNGPLPFAFAYLLLQAALYNR